MPLSQVTEPDFTVRPQAQPSFKASSRTGSSCRMRRTREPGPRGPTTMIRASPGNLATASSGAVSRSQGKALRTGQLVRRPDDHVLVGRPRCLGAEPLVSRQGGQRLLVLVNG